MYISNTCTHLLLLHPPAVASVAGPKMGDTEAGRHKTQQLATKNTPGDNKMLCLGAEGGGGTKDKLRQGMLMVSWEEKMEADYKGEGMSD